MPTTTATIDHLVAPEQITAETKPASIFERGEPCWKCDGTGRIRGFAHVHGGICFRCNGVGTPLTKRGAAARRYFEALSTTTLTGLRPGDRVLELGDGITRGTSWQTFESVADNRVERSTGRILDVERSADLVAEAIERGDVVEPTWTGSDRERGAVVVYGGVNVKLGNVTRCGERGDGSYRVSDRATLVARMKAAAEYQRALTKSGTPRKGTRYADAA